ncbi:MAG TPA: ribose-phosphate diphosphokinase [Bryobacteraceae bacterium]|nr:ribose-phosphate diphosphokinase [Bryobacteraceae bacterium]
MILFASEAFRPMAETLAECAGLLPSPFQAARFENGELHVEVNTSVKGERCFLLGSIAPPDEQMLCALLLAHTLKKEGARNVTAILPYLAYARHDKEKPAESLGTAWIGSMAQASGIDEVITVDVHSARAKKLFPIPVVSLSPAEIFAEAIKRFGLMGSTIVAPDEGAIARCEAVKGALRIPCGETPYFEKHRTTTGITHVARIGAVSRRVVIIDDILDTGGTLVSACERLREAQAEEIYIMVTHGLFTGDRWRKLWQLGVKRIFCTDSVPIAGGLDGGRIERLSVVPLLEQELCPLSRV